MKQCILILALLAGTFTTFAQDEEEEIKEGGFKKENLFIGGSISLSFGNRSTLVGANPMIGYKIADWIDAGIVFNYQFTNFRYLNNDKLRQNIYGGGIFTRLFPVNFLFGQIQAEHNLMSLKYIYSGGQTSDKANTSANSLLVGGGIAQGRMSGFNDPFVYFCILFDVSGNEVSPYTDLDGNGRIIYRAGANFPLFRR